MFEGLYAPLPQIEPYLERMRFSGHRGVSRKTLDALIVAHLEAVPFENLDIYDHDRDIPLDIDAIFEKIVLRKRGGYCFELNGLFMALLQALGFSCEAVMARVVWNKDYLPPYTHRATVVHLEGKRLFCDVGYGGPSPGTSLEFETGKVQRSPGGLFVFEPHAKGRLLSRMADEARQPVLLINDTPAELVDFVSLNAYCSKHASSFFRSKRMANIKTKAGNNAIDGDILRVRCGDVCTERTLHTAQQVQEALRTHFGIEAK